MKNLKKLVSILLISILTISCGMQNKAILYFNDGKKLKGFGEITSNDMVKFRMNDSKVQKYNFKDLKRVSISTEKYGSSYLNYVRMKIKGQDSYKVLQEVILGTVNLYQVVAQGYTMAAPMGGGGYGGGGMMMGGGYYSISNYYVRRAGETEVTHLGSTSLFSKNFKKAASAYFSDCVNLVAKIQLKEFKKRHIEDIVTYYNNKCN